MRSGRIGTPAHSRAGDESERAHRAEVAASSFWIGANDALGELGVKRTLHAIGVAFVPSLDVIHRGLTNAGAIGGGGDVLAGGALSDGRLRARNSQWTKGKGG